MNRLRMIRLEPDPLELHMEYACRIEARGRLTDALEIYAKCVDGYKAGNTNKALELAEHMLEIDEDQPEMRTRLVEGLLAEAKAFLSYGLADQAEVYLRRAHQWSQQPARIEQIAAGLGIAFDAVGDWEEPPPPPELGNLGDEPTTLRSDEESRGASESPGGQSGREPDAVVARFYELMANSSEEAWLLSFDAPGADGCTALRTTVSSDRRKGELGVLGQKVRALLDYSREVRGHLGAEALINAFLFGDGLWCTMATDEHAALVRSQPHQVGSTLIKARRLLEEVAA
ncbi:hypothetical protein FIV42_17900 [Persicimonas caeni]|uniref:Tetratricopeptide repeat protein n=1 Tax=Persicimonas caeni TaxID=2292766 RepID=A0A4Y6PWD7_PERCE|nr:hypothetical protein [Persicimonas caeni]QDG52540.1 hypothetical protein FIV42_17900 [Persicimonas caeni]QED33762.1 hypothetical protein FRD00_17895 [Persicimonas caeni]